ncbi:hypothetical protein JCM8097_003701 [Rhodosporidiobolus ruineniae]
MPRLLLVSLTAALVASLYALCSPLVPVSPASLTRLKHCMTASSSDLEVGVAPLSPSAGTDEAAGEGKSVLMDQVIMFGDSITQGSWVAGGTGAELAHLWQRKLCVRAFAGLKSGSG